MWLEKCVKKSPQESRSVGVKPEAGGGGGGGALDISLGGEVRPDPSYPDPVYDKNRWFSYPD